MSDSVAKIEGARPDGGKCPRPPRHNYQRDLEYIIRGLEKQGEAPTLLLHACCAPCSSYCLEYLSNYFRITVFYYNPNIAPEKEYQLRVAEIKRFVSEIKTKYPVTLIEGKYEPRRFYDYVKGLENEPEGGARCRKCFELRLSESVKLARELGMDYVTTSLTISPLKDAQVLNDVVQEQCDLVGGVKRLPTDFKKKGGYKRSTELSEKHGLYRQNFCGCVFSMRKADCKVEGEPG
ncbi:MAG: epoxyqueuosine reductase QueH [Fibrobacter sp.]|nr:epoxyqueuosine reductase QueH [Fibrobacter sp.]